MKRFIDDFNYFETESLVRRLNEELSDFSIHNYQSFGLVGVTSNTFFRTFDVTTFNKNTSAIEQLPSEDSYFRIKRNYNNEVDTFLFFASAENPILPSLFQTISNFEHVMMYFSGDRFDRELIKRQDNEFKFRTRLSPRRWIQSDRYLEVNMNILHSLMNIIQYPKIS
jgi:hypothetical protein